MNLRDVHIVVMRVSQLYLLSFFFVMWIRCTVALSSWLHPQTWACRHPSGAAVRRRRTAGTLIQCCLLLKHPDRFRLLIGSRIPAGAGEHKSVDSFYLLSHMSQFLVQTLFKSVFCNTIEIHNCNPFLSIPYLMWSDLNHINIELHFILRSQLNHSCKGAIYCIDLASSIVLWYLHIRYVA